MTFEERIPDADTLIALEPEEVGRSLLLEIKKEQHARRHVSGHNLCHRLASHYGTSGVDRSGIQRVLSEAWDWVVFSRLVTLSPHSSSGDWYVLSRRAERLLESDYDLAVFQAASQFPDELLHPAISEVAQADFLRGHFESAILKAFKVVEVSVREAAFPGSHKYGEPLMREAFHPETGPLTDQDEQSGEREALAHLFAGAYGRFKNPSSHRYVAVEPVETIEALVLASLLLRIVERRHEMRVKGTAAGS